MYRPTDRQKQMFGTGTAGAVQLRLAKTWAEPFQEKVLPLLFRAEARFADLYCEDNGRPNWSIARRLGICLLQELSDLTDQDILDAVAFDVRYQHALDLRPDDAYLSRRSLTDFRGRMVRHDPEMKQLRTLFDEVADAAIEDLGLSVRLQRTDSTHLASNVRTRGRVDLFSKTLRNFLRELAVSAPALADTLPTDLREWATGHEESGEFGHAGARTELAKLAQWAVEIVRLYQDVEDVCSWESWELVRRIVREHCRIVPSGGGEPPAEERDPIDVRIPEGATLELAGSARNGGRSLQSPFDPDVTYGHKGEGYMAQLSETAGNERTEILTDFELRPAASNDWGQTTPVIDRLEAVDRKPEIMLTDGGYPHATALLEAEARGVVLHGPVPDGGLPADVVGRDQFEFAPDGTVLRCPAGHAPLRHADRKHANQAERTPHAYFDGGTCRTCPLVGRCVARGGRTGSYRVETRRELLLRDRAVTRQRTDAAWRAEYRMRAGIEATNSELKRRHGLGRLRVRRRPRVLFAVTMKLTACNAKRWIKASAASA